MASVPFFHPPRVSSPRIVVSFLDRRLTSGDQGASGWGDRWLEGPVVETLPDFLDLAKELLVTQWHCFQPAVVSIRAASPLHLLAERFRCHIQAGALCFFIRWRDDH